MVFLILSCVFVLVSSEEVHNIKKRVLEVKTEISRSDRDSYLDAYAESHGGNIEENQVKTDRDFPTGFPGGFSDEHFGVQYPYPAPSHPQHQYGSPQQMYGPPHGPPPRPSYGPPHGPPNYPPPNYGPPIQPPIYGIPYGLEGILDKLKLKFDLITIFKILLKIVLFKKLVSFIAIICLLLFIPWLKAKKAIHHHGGGGGGGGHQHDDEEEDQEDDLMMRNFQGSNRLNNITVYVLEAIEKFSRNDSKASSLKCDTVSCTVNRIARNFSN